MYAHQVAVGRESDVALESLGSVSDGFEVGPARVLGIVEARAAMSDDLRPHVDKCHPIHKRGAGPAGRAAALFTDSWWSGSRRATLATANATG